MVVQEQGNENHNNTDRVARSPLQRVSGSAYIKHLNRPFNIKIHSESWSFILRKAHGMVVQEQGIENDNNTDRVAR